MNKALQPEDMRHPATGEVLILGKLYQLAVVKLAFYYTIPQQSNDAYGNIIHGTRLVRLAHLDAPRKKSILTFLGYEFLHPRADGGCHTLKFMDAGPPRPSGEILPRPRILYHIFLEGNAAFVTEKFRLLQVGDQRKKKKTRKPDEPPSPEYLKVLQAREKGLTWAQPKSQKVLAYQAVRIDKHISEPWAELQKRFTELKRQHAKPKNWKEL